MDENKDYTTRYEPNFVLRDATPQAGSYTGSYTDPRANFSRGAQNAQNAQNPGQQSQGAQGTQPGQSAGPEQPRDNFANAEGTTYFNNDFDGAGNAYEMPPAHGNKKKKEKKPSPVVTLTRKSLAFLIVAVMAVSMLFGAGSGAITHNLMDSGSSPSHSGVSSNGAYTLEDSTSAAMSISQITEKTQKSVVEIRTESVASDSWMREYVTQGAGSGVIISSDGYIMTNNHVIDGARKITVTTIDEKSYSAKLVGTDPRNDVAVLKIKAEGLEAATYGNSNQLQVGDLAVAIGNPLGELGGTVTSGIISSLDRQLSIDGKSMNLLQTDASINPGNSGGGLFNDDGQLIGLVVAKSSGSDVEGLGFAIPINTAAEVANQLMEKGYVSGEAYTGMSYQEGYVSGQGGESGGFDEFFGGGQSQQQTAVYITEVIGKHAKEAGFQPGDMVYAVDDKIISTFDELSTIITTKKPGDKIKYTIVRNGEIKNIKFELEEKGHEEIEQ